MITAVVVCGHCDWVQDVATAAVLTDTLQAARIIATGDFNVIMFVCVWCVDRELDNNNIRQVNKSWLYSLQSLRNL